MKSSVVQKHKAAFKKEGKQLRNFITRQEKKLKNEDLALVQESERFAWSKINCLDCANCCKTMTPTYTKTDIERISAHLKMTPEEFKGKWLVYDKKDRVWINKSLPCQFLDLTTNKCTIYSVKPASCAEFPHLVKRPFKDYFYIHKQNVEYCPATFEMIKKLKELKKP